MSEFELNDRIKIEGENGYYWVRGFGSDGSLSLWGGDKNPNGHRQFKAVMPDRARHDSRDLARKSYPEPLEVLPSV